MEINNNNLKEINIISEVENVRLDKFLTEEVEDFSRTQIQDIIKKGLVTINDVVSKASNLVYLNDKIKMIIPEPEVTDILPENIDLDIYYEDKDVIVVNKPSGMVVHPAIGNYSNTLVNALLYHCKDLSAIGGVVRAGIVHRIDKDTSGLLVACKNDAAHKHLSEQFLNKTVTRKYYAICYGVIDHNFGKIDAPLGRDKLNRQKYAVVEGGKKAITTFKVLERFKDYTLLELILETGRTHQIRVHMSYIGHPVLGDPLYGPRKVFGNNGQYLHAKTLGFIHPSTNKYMEFDSPLPDFFEDLLTELRNNK